VKMKFFKVIIFIFTAFISLTLSQSLTESFYKDCNKVKGCIGFPKGCLDTGSCTLAVTYVGISNKKYEFVSLIKQGGDKKYLAMGLSMSGLMADSSVVACSGNSTQTHIRMYWNIDGDSLPLKDESLGLSDTSLVFEDGYMFCKFTRDALIQFETPGPKSKNVTIDINTEDYAIVIADGQVDKSGLIMYHDRRESTEKLGLYKFNQFLNIYYGCGDMKGCFGNPPGCIEKEDCQQLTTFQGISSEEYKFEVLGNVSRLSVTWIGVGLNPTKGMADAR